MILQQCEYTQRVTFFPSFKTAKHSSYNKTSWWDSRKGLLSLLVLPQHWTGWNNWVLKLNWILKNYSNYLESYNFQTNSVWSLFYYVPSDNIYREKSSLLMHIMEFTDGYKVYFAPFMFYFRTKDRICNRKRFKPQKSM